MTVVVLLLSTWMGVASHSPQPPSCAMQQRAAQALLAPWLAAQREYARTHGEFAGSLEVLAREGLAPRMTYTSRQHTQVALLWATEKTLSLEGRLDGGDSAIWEMDAEGRLVGSDECAAAGQNAPERPADAQLFWARIDTTPLVFTEDDSDSGASAAKASQVEREFLRAHLRKLGVAGEVVAAKNATLNALRRIFDVANDSAPLADITDVSDWSEDWVNGALIETTCFAREKNDYRVTPDARAADSKKGAQRALQLTKKLGASRVIWAAEDEARVSTKKVGARDIHDFASLQPGVIADVFEEGDYDKTACIRSVVTVCRTTGDKRVCDGIAKANGKWRGLDAHPQREGVRRAGLLVTSPALVLSPALRADVVRQLIAAEKALTQREEKDRSLPIAVRPLREWVVGIEGPGGVAASADDVFASSPAFLAQRVTSREAQEALSEWAWNIAVKKAGRTAEWQETQRNWQEARKQKRKSVPAHTGNSDEDALDAVRALFVSTSFPDEALTEAFFNAGIVNDLERYQDVTPLHVIRRVCIRDLATTDEIKGEPQKKAWIANAQRIRAQALAVGGDESARIGAFRAATRKAKLDVIERVAEKSFFDEEAQRDAELHKAFARVPPPDLCLVETFALCPSFEKCAPPERERLVMQSKRRSMVISDPDRWLEDAGVVMSGRGYTGPHVIGSDKILRGARDNDVVVRVGASAIRFGQLRPKEYDGRARGERTLKKTLEQLVEELASAEQAAQLAKSEASTRVKWAAMMKAKTPLEIDDLYEGGHVIQALWLATPVALDDPEVTKRIDDDLAHSVAQSFACHRVQPFKLSAGTGACEAHTLAKAIQKVPAAERTRMLLACNAVPDSARATCGADASNEGRDALDRIDIDATWVHKSAKDEPLTSILVTTGALKDVGKDEMQAHRRRWAAAEVRSERVGKIVWKQRRAIIRAAVVPDDPSLAWVREELASLGEDR